MAQSSQTMYGLTMTANREVAAVLLVMLNVVLGVQQCSGALQECAQKSVTQLRN